MKSFDYEAVYFDGDVYCVECLTDAEDEDVTPIFADSEVLCWVTCCVCGTEHDYMTKIEESGTAAEETIDDAG